MLSRRLMLRPSGMSAGVSITDTTSNVLGTGYQEAGYQLTSGGVVNKLASSFPSYFENWLSSGVTSDYEVRVTDIGGGLNGGSAVGSWLNLGTTRQWTLGEGTTGASLSNTILVEIRDVATGTIRDSATITLNVFIF